MSLVLVLAIVLVACVGTTGYSLLRLVHGSTGDVADRPAVDGRVASGSPVSSGPPGSPVASASAVTDLDTPKASSYPVRTADDLTRVCDRWYYPQSPAYAAAPAPHPITILVKDRMDLPSRIAKSFYGQPPGNTAAVRAAWEPADPTAVQLVACLDLVDAGKPIRGCDFDDPKPDTLPMSEGIYQLSVYEVATHRKVAEARMTGEDEDCPTIVMFGGTRMLYSAVTDRQLVEGLTRYVEQ